MPRSNKNKSRTTALATKATSTPTTRQDVKMAEVKANRNAKIADAVVALLRTLARCAVVAYGLYIFGGCVRDLAGEDTALVAFLDIGAKIELDRWVCLAIALLGGGGYVVQKRANKKLVRDNAKYITELEQLADPKRTSSHLLEDGSPDKEDLHGA